MNTGPTPLSERDPYPFPQPEGDLQFRGKDDSKNYKDPHKIISRKEVIFQKFDEISKKNCLTVTVRDDYTPTVRGGTVLPRHFIMAFSMLIGKR